MKAAIYNHSLWQEDSGRPGDVRERFKELILKSGFSIVGFIDHSYDPQGYTAVWLLAESHLAVHTFPEHGKIYIEISSCNLDMYAKFLRLIER